MVFTHAKFPQHIREILGKLELPMLEGFGVRDQYMSKHGIAEYVGSVLTISETDPHPSALQHELLAEVLVNYVSKEFHIEE